MVDGELIRHQHTTDVIAEVIGGLPPPTNYMWTEQMDDGTTMSYPAGQGSSSAVVRKTCIIQ